MLSNQSFVIYLYTRITSTYIQVLGYSVIASSSTAVKQDYNEYMWTLRREYVDHPSAPLITTCETASVVERDNLANIGREAMSELKIKSDD